MEGKEQFKDKVRNVKMGKGNVNDEVEVMIKETKRVLECTSKEEVSKEGYRSRVG